MDVPGYYTKEFLYAFCVLLYWNASDFKQEFLAVKEWAGIDTNDCLCGILPYWNDQQFTEESNRFETMFVSPHGHVNLLPNDDF